MIERRLLQVVVAIASLIPISAGAMGILLGPAMVQVHVAPAAADSHYRYLSGLLLGIRLRVHQHRVRGSLASPASATGISDNGGFRRPLSLLLRGSSGRYRCWVGWSWNCVSLRHSPFGSLRLASRLRLKPVARSFAVCQWEPPVGAREGLRCRSAPRGWGDQPDGRRPRLRTAPPTTTGSIITIALVGGFQPLASRCRSTVSLTSASIPASAASYLMHHSPTGRKRRLLDQFLSHLVTAPRVIAMNPCARSYLYVALRSHDRR